MVLELSTNLVLITIGSIGLNAVDHNVRVTVLNQLFYEFHRQVVKETHKFLIELW